MGVPVCFVPRNDRSGFPHSLFLFHFITQKRAQTMLQSLTQNQMQNPVLRKVTRAAQSLPTLSLLSEVFYVKT